MKKVILNFRGQDSREEIQEYIAKQMDFPIYYGRNLDALYDCLTDIMEPMAIGCYFSERQQPELEEYMEKLKETFTDAEEDNHNLAVFFGRQER